MKTVKTTLTGIEGTPGLFLKRTPAGGRTYIYRYREKESGRKREIALGAIGEIEAKIKALEFAAQRKKDVDPADAHRDAKEKKAVQARAEVKRITFRAAAEAYADAHAPDWKHAYARANWLNPIRKYAYPAIGNRLLDDIEVEHIEAVLKNARKFPGTARRVRQHIALILDYAAGRGQRNAAIRNPADPKLHRSSVRRKRGEGEHYRRVKLNDAPSVFRRIQELAADSTALSAWVFLIATATRGSEALKARWSEIDLDAKAVDHPGGADEERSPARHPAVLARARRAQAAGDGPHRRRSLSWLERFASLLQSFRQGAGESRDRRRDAA